MSVGPSAITYEASLKSTDPWVIEVRATFEGGASRGPLTDLLVVAEKDPFAPPVSGPFP